MKPVVYIFQNTGTENFPAGNQWEQFPPEMSDIRLFNFAARSWEEMGFEVRRLVTWSLGPAERWQFLPNGNGPALAAKWYPPEYWQLLAAVLNVLENEWEDLNLFTSLDVQNVCYSAEMFKGDFMTVESGREFLNFQSEHFSLSTFFCTRKFCHEAKEILQAYDYGNVAQIPAEYVSDERILRDMYPRSKVANLNRQTFGAEGSALVHHARSTLNERFNRYKHNA
jgi:hypothetical protein